jgi:urease accessory protein
MDAAGSPKPDRIRVKTSEERWACETVFFAGSAVNETAAAQSNFARHLSRPGTAVLARSRGSVRLVLKNGPAGTVLERLYQSGCLRVRLPRPECGAIPEPILINTAGGLTGGDNIDVSAEWRPNTSGTFVTQAAEKLYRAGSGTAVVKNRLVVGIGACAEWLPQETIFFNRAALDRSLEVHVSGGSRFLGLESIVFGRTAMREEVVSGSIRDSWKIFRESRLIYADVFELQGQIAGALNENAIAAGARACASIIFVADAIAPGLLQSVRDILPNDGGQAAATTWNGVLAVRILARNGEALKHIISRVLWVLRTGRALPRVWQC